MSGDTQPQTVATRQGESIAIVVADAPDANTGKLVHAQISTTPFAKGETALIPQVARYTLGDDDALTLVTTSMAIPLLTNEFGLRAIMCDFAPRS